MAKLTIAPDVVAPPGYRDAQDLMAAALALAPDARNMLEATGVRVTLCSADTRSAAVDDDLSETTDGFLRIETGVQAHFATLVGLIAHGRKVAGGWLAPDADTLASTLAHEALHAVFGNLDSADTAAARAAIRQDGKAFIAAAEAFGPRLRTGDPRKMDSPAFDGGWDFLAKRVAEDRPDLCERAGADPRIGAHYWQFAVRLANADAATGHLASLGGDALDGQRDLGRQISYLENEAVAHFVQVAMDASRRGLPVDPPRVAAARKLMADGTKALLSFADAAPKAFADVANRAMDILSRDGTQAHLSALAAMAEAATNDTAPDRGPAEAAKDAMVAAVADAGRKLGVVLLDEMAAESGLDAAVNTLSLAGGQIERWAALGRGACPMDPREASRTAAVLAELPAMAAGLMAARDEVEQRTGRVRNWHFDHGTGKRIVPAILSLGEILHARHPHPPRDRVAALVNLQASMAEAERHIRRGHADAAASAIHVAAGLAADCGHADMAQPLSALSEACRTPGRPDAKEAALRQAWQMAFPGTDAFKVTVSDHQAAILGFRDPTKTVADDLRPMAAAAAEKAVGGIFLRIAENKTNSVIREIGGAAPTGWLLSHPHYLPMLGKIYGFAAHGTATALRAGIASIQAMRSRLDQLHPSRGLATVRAVLGQPDGAEMSAMAAAQECCAAYKAARLLPPAERTVAVTALWNRIADSLLDAEEDNAPLTRQNIGGITQMLGFMRAELPPGVAEAEGNPLDTAGRLAAAMDRQNRNVAKAASRIAAVAWTPSAPPPAATRSR